MTKLDLRKLSAPIEALRPALSAAYERLDSKWVEISKCLKALPIPSTISHTFDHNEYNHEDFKCLVWKKYNAKKRICIEVHIFNPNLSPYTDYDVTTTPYDEWSGQQRIDMLEHVPGLFAAAEKSTREFIEKIQNEET